MKVKEKTLGKKAAPTTVAWISDFPVEWLPDIPEPLRSLPKQHPGTWQMVLLSELEKNPALRIHIVILRKQIDKDFSFERNGVFFHILKIPSGWRAPTLFWIDTILIRRALKKIRPDLIHAWGTERGAALICSRLNYPYLVTIQGLLTWYQQVVPLTAHERFAAAVEKISLKRAKLATTESAFAVQFLRKKYPRLDVHQAEHAPNWLFHRVERRAQTKPIRFISIATLGYRKGTDLLLRALDELSREMDFELVMISGPNQVYLQTLKPNLSPEFWRRITFKTHLLPVDVARELAVATMLLLPTRADTSPNAVKEAVVAGVPVIASRIGGIVDYVYHGKNGFLFSSNDLPRFVQAIRDAGQHPLFSQGSVDPETLKQTRKYLSPETMEKRFVEAYEQELNCRKI
jgi:glycosyltransferase involved in cell wall biosynthesis